MTAISKNHSRRAFLQRAAAMSSVGAGSFGVNLAGIGAASAQTAATNDYKALVCIFLFGGNDQSNTVIPFADVEYNAYAAARPSLAVAKANLLPLAPTGYNGPTLGLPVEMSALKALFDQGRCAIMSNVGVLNVPTTRLQYQNELVSLPPQLFSHSDQQSHWQTSLPDQSVKTGWGGRMGDLLAAQNTGALSVAMSVAGNALYLAGDNVVQYQLTTRGSVNIEALNGLYGFSAGSIALKKLLTESRAHLFENELTQVGARAIQADNVISSALANTPALATPFPANNRLASQLAMVARMIAARERLGFKRQVFFVSMGGFDVHDNLPVDQPRLLGLVSQAMAAFYNATVELGVAQSVTSFTASDFGRALQFNGRGSDHGWGGHHFVCGGAVNGNRIAGTWPDVRLKSNDDAGQGRLIPTTSVDQYAAEMARWMGVASSELATVLPNLGRFSTSGLGLFRA
jgi:uncharacterized protein (DUF1501 family)